MVEHQIALHDGRIAELREKVAKVAVKMAAFAAAQLCHILEKAFDLAEKPAELRGAVRVARKGGPEASRAELLIPPTLPLTCDDANGGNRMWHM